MTSDRRSCGQKPTYEDRVGEASRYATCALRAEIIGVGAFGRRLGADKLRGDKLSEKPTPQKSKNRSKLRTSSNPGIEPAHTLYVTLYLTATNVTATLSSLHT